LISDVFASLFGNSHPSEGAATKAERGITRQLCGADRGSLPIEQNQRKEEFEEWTTVRCFFRPKPSGNLQKFSTCLLRMKGDNGKSARRAHVLTFLDSARRALVLTFLDKATVFSGPQRKSERALRLGLCFREIAIRLIQN